MPPHVKILLVQRDQTAAMAAAQSMRNLGWEVLTAADGMQAIGVALKTRPNALVLSTDLPAGGGLNVLKRIRQFADTACAPVIAISSSTGPQKSELLAAGAQEVLEGPASAQAVCDALQRHLPQPLRPLEAPKEVIANAGRIAALESTGLLDAGKDTFLDALTRLGSTLTGAPIMLVSLVHKDRQIFKSHVGLAAPNASIPETPLSHSFCQWVVSANEPLVVADARQHPALQSNLAIKDLGVIAYAGVPLLENTSQAIGSFCAIDAKPRAWSDTELATLSDLGKLVEAFSALGQAKRASQPDPTLATPANSHQNARVVSRAVANGISAAARILLRATPSLGAAEHDQLLDMITSLAAELRGARP